MLVNVFNIDLFEFSSAILEKGLLLLYHYITGLLLVALLGTICRSHPGWAGEGGPSLWNGRSSTLVKCELRSLRSVGVLSPCKTTFMTDLHATLNDTLIIDTLLSKLATV